MNTQNHLFYFPKNISFEHIETINGVKFTRREIDIIACILHMRGTSKISSLLSIAPKTVEAHTSNVMRKMDCNSRERVIDFVERSGKSSLIDKYYQHLLIQSIFEKELKKLLVSKKEVTCLLTYWKKHKDKELLIYQLEKHLKLLGLKIIVGDGEKQKPSMLYLQQVDHTISIVTEELIKQFQVEDKTKVDQSASKNPSNVIYILLDREKTPPVPKELTNIENILIDVQENYYFLFFAILKKLFPHIALHKTISDFKTQYELIYDSSKQAPLREEGSQREKESISNILIEVIRKGKIKLLLGAGLCLGTSCSLILFLNLNYLVQKNQYNKVGETYSLRNDLPIPTEKILLKRSNLMSQLKEKLEKQQKKQEIQIIALVGIGGAGKTILARQYARTAKAFVVWEINSETKNNIMSSFIDLAYALAKTLQQKNEIEFIQKVQNPDEKRKQLLFFIRKFLKENPGWILIYDNVENFSDIKNYFPNDPEVWGAGKVIITTRDSNIKNNSHLNPENVIQVQELNKEEKQTLFMNIISEKNVQEVDFPQKSKLEAFLTQISPFPLDISTAAYYIKDTNISYGEYLKRIQSSNVDFEKTQETLLKEVGDYEHTRYEIITLTLKKIIEEHPDFKELLLLVSLVDSQNISKSLLEHCNKNIIVEQFISSLRRHSLIKSDENTPTFSVHRSIQAISLTFISHLLNINETERFLDKVITSIKTFNKAYLERNCVHMTALLPHLEVLMKNLEKIKISEREKYEMNLFLVVGYAHYNCFRNFILAKKYLFQAYKIQLYNPLLPPPILAVLLKDLGSISVQLEDFDESLSYCQESIKLSHNVPNSEILVAENLRLIGYAYCQKNDFQKSYHSLKSALETIAGLKEEVKKEEDAAIYSILATLYSKTYINGDKAYEAEKYANKALETLNATQLFCEDLKAKSVELSCTEVSCSVERRKSVLGQVYCRLGKYQDALKKGLQEAEFIISRRPSNRRDNLLKSRVYTSMGEALLREGNVEEAEKKLTESIFIALKLMGENDTAEARVFRAEALIRLGKLTKAYEDCEAVLRLERKARNNYLDLIHCICIYHAAVIKYKQGDMEKSLKHFSDFFKNIQLFCKSFLDKKKYNELESKEVYRTLVHDPKQTNVAVKESFKRSKEILSVIYVTSHPFIQDYVLHN